MSEPIRFTVFYSWQSDLPDESNRVLIRQALRTASSSIEKSNGDLIVEIDEATRDVSGSPNIPATILAKINVADIFVCDVSTINTNESGRKTPNPNVVFELGYAIANLGWERVVLLFNEEFGSFPADLPFDFDRHRVSAFRSTNPPSTKQKKKLSDLAELAISSVITNNPEKPNSAKSPEEKKRNRDIKNLHWVLSTLHLPTLDQHIVNCPHMLMDKVLHFWEGFNGVMTNSLFHLYDQKLAKLFHNFHIAFHETVRHGECYHPNMSSIAYIFTAPGGMHLDNNKEEIWNSIRKSADQMHEIIRELLAEIREKYIEISIDDTNREAWREFLQFRKEQAEALEGDT
jgi:hypothetical protein